MQCGRSANKVSWRRPSQRWFCGGILGTGEAAAASSASFWDEVTQSSHGFLTRVTACLSACLSPCFNPQRAYYTRTKGPEARQDAHSFCWCDLPTLEASSSCIRAGRRQSRRGNAPSLAVLRIRLLAYHFLLTFTEERSLNLSLE